EGTDTQTRYLSTILVLPDYPGDIVPVGLHDLFHVAAVTGRHDYQIGLAHIPDQPVGCDGVQTVVEFRLSRYSHELHMKQRWLCLTCHIIIDTTEQLTRPFHIS